VIAYRNARVALKEYESTLKAPKASDIDAGPDLRLEELCADVCAAELAKLTVGGDDFHFPPSTARPDPRWTWQVVEGGGRVLHFKGKPRNVCPSRK